MLENLSGSRYLYTLLVGMPPDAIFLVRSYTANLGNDFLLLLHYCLTTALAILSLVWEKKMIPILLMAARLVISAKWKHKSAPSMA